MTNADVRAPHGERLRQHKTLCGGSFRTRYTAVADPQTGEQFRIDACTRCGLGLTIPEPDDLERYYGDRYYGGRHWLTRAYCAWRRTRVIDIAIGGSERGVIVDIGCGDGTFLHAAKRRGWRVLGTEINAAMPAAAGLEVWGSIADLRKRGPFDCITLWHSFEHLRDPVQGIKELADMLSPDGAIVIAVPNAQGWQARLFGRNWLHLDVPRHLHHFTLPSLEHVLGGAHLEVVRVWHHEVEYDWFGWIQSALNTMQARPNVLFDLLTRHGHRPSLQTSLLNLVAGVFLLFPALVLTVLSTWAQAGGTLIVAARRRP